MFGKKVFWQLFLWILAAVMLQGIGCSDANLVLLSDEMTVSVCGTDYPADSTQLDLTGFTVTEAEVEALLPEFSNLKKLILGQTDLDDDALDALNRRHPETEIVWTVSVGRLKIRTDETCFYCANKGYLPNNEDLKKLRYCTEMVAVDIGHLRATECEWLEYMPHVKYLILADTGITDISPVANLKELLYLELFGLEIQDYSPLLGCTALQDLNISRTHADPEPLSHMTWLHNIHWYQSLSNPGTRDAVKQLPEQLPDTLVWLDMVGDISNPWRNLPNYYVFRDMIGGEFLNQSFTQQNWGREDAGRILACDGHEPFAGEVLAQIVKERMEQGLPIVGIKNPTGEKAMNLYRALCEAAENVKDVTQ